MNYTTQMKRRATSTPWRSRKKKVFRKPTRKPVTTSSNIKKDVYAFKRRYHDGTIPGNAVYAPYLQGLSTSLNRLPGISDFSNLFDRYMITYIKVYYHLKIDPSAQSGSVATFPKLYYVRDYDDGSAPLSLNEMREHSKCTYRVLNPNKPVVFGFRPSTLTEKYRSPISTTYSPQWNQWIDMAAPDVPHYGWKIGIDDLTNTNYKVDVEVVMWFKCKDTR